MKKYKEFEEHLKKLNYLNSASALLSWDQEVYLPADAAEHRAQTLSYLSSLQHETFCSAKFGNLMEELLNLKKLTEIQRLNVEKTYQDWKESTLVPSEYVRRSSYASAIAFEAWHRAKNSNDFSLFAPHLQKVVDLQKERLKYTKWKGKIYDGLLEEYEKGLKMETLDSLFSRVKEELIPLSKKATEQTSSTFPLRGKFSAASQRSYNLDLLKRIGYDLNRGRLDESVHPFSTAMHPTDSRITTNFDDKNLSSVWSTMHEAGHGMYEQGLNAEESHLPSGKAISLSLHESQSRFWENMIGKNLLFWKNEFKNLREFFKEDLLELDIEDFWKKINKVEPSLVRIDADEITYHMHIIIRYEIERAIFEEGARVEDLPAMWNQKYKEYLGVEVSSDSEGILQDVHWSCGMFGYFPTYTLGSMYAAQFYAHLKKEIDIENKIAKEDYASIKTWMNEKIHSLGGLYNAEEACEKVTGEKLDPTYFLKYIQEKYSL
jgi:carboxypeptidase Taq